MMRRYFCVTEEAGGHALRFTELYLPNRSVRVAVHRYKADDAKLQSGDFERLKRALRTIGTLPQRPAGSFEGHG